MSPVETSTAAAGMAANWISRGPTRSSCTSTFAAPRTATSAVNPASAATRRRGSGGMRNDPTTDTPKNAEGSSISAPASQTTAVTAKLGPATRR